MAYTTLLPDFYGLLQVPRNASPNDVKIAYHRTLLRLHPDKQSRPRHHGSSRVIAAPVATHASADPPATPPPDEASVDVALLKEAYRTLSDAGSRAEYDASLTREMDARSHGPRPAQVISLDEFGLGPGLPGTGTVEALTWRYGCRCGGAYHITQDDLESGTHLVGCESCSEVIWVGYEEAPMGEEGGDSRVHK